MKNIKSYSLIIIFLFLTTLGQSQAISDFENLGLPNDSFDIGATGNLFFKSQNVIINTNFNPDWNSWDNWAISTMRDTVTTGFMNDLSSSNGSGNNGSMTYAVGSAFTPISLELTSSANYSEGLYLNNSTYAYLSMLNGDSFAKKFGGETGDDPDYFLITIKGLLNGQSTTDSIDFYLADYRFSDNAQDYIIKKWTYVDLSILGIIDGLTFSLRSTDNGSFGMNTPAYFCVDDINTSIILNENNLELQSDINFYPNPVSNQININWEKEATMAKIFNTNGYMVREVILRSNSQNSFDVSDLDSGLYYFQSINNEISFKKPFIKI